jgi:hypothetical protein
MRTALALICLSGTLVLAQTKHPGAKPPDAKLAEQTAAPEAYPVWWDPDLGLDKIEDADALLSKPFDENDIEHLRENAGSISSGQHQPDVHNCKELLAVIDPDDYRSLNRVNEWGLIGVRCAEIKALSHVIPARHSAVRNDKWTNELFSQLPAAIAFADGEKSHWEAIQAEKKGLSLSQYWRGKGRHGFQIDEQVLLLGTNGQCDDSYHIVARGDFTGDGWEDLLIEGGGSSTPHRDYYSAYLLTRKSANERFKIVKTIF